MVPRATEIYNLYGETMGTIALPAVFPTQLMSDVIGRAVLHIHFNQSQSQDSGLFARKKTVVDSCKTSGGVVPVFCVKADSVKNVFVSNILRSRSQLEW